MERMKREIPKHCNDLDRIRALENDNKRLEEENKKLKEENEYRKKIADVLPEGEGHIAEETIQDLQKEIKLLKMSLEEKDENCYSLAKENKELKEKIKYIRKLNTYDYNELQDLIILLEEKNKKLKERIEALELCIDVD